MKLKEREGTGGRGCRWEGLHKGTRVTYAAGTRCEGMDDDSIGHDIQTLSPTLTPCENT